MLSNLGLLKEVATFVFFEKETDIFVVVLIRFMIYNLLLGHSMRIPLLFHVNSFLLVLKFGYFGLEEVCAKLDVA